MRRHRDRETGQVLMIFAFGLVGILAIAALVFDVGQDLLERRNQQKAADAAALAGARYLTTDTCKAAYTLAACPEARDAAVELATTNGYTDGGTVDVAVKIPPGPESNHHNQPGHIQVTVTITRSTYFANILGMSSSRVSTIAVARNASELSVAHSMIALSEGACQAAKFGGNGTVTVEGSIQIDSTCSSALFGAGSNVTVHAPACYVVGGYEYHTKSDVDCDYPGPGLDPPVSGVDPAGDPLESMRGPTLAGAGSGAAVKVEIAGSGTLDDCPLWRPLQPPDLTDAGTMENPKTCKLGVNNATLRMYPGVYFGGLQINGNSSQPTVILMEPGIYYLAGGGLKIAGGGLTIRTVAANGTTDGGGILIYNTDDPYFRTVCTNGTYTGAGCIGPISVTGNGNSDTGPVIHLEPYQLDPYKNILIYQDRWATSQPGLDISGEGRILELSGTIYLPGADVKISGRGDSIAAQIIADTWNVTGNGTLNITYDADSLVKFRGTGLVQ